MRTQMALWLYILLMIVIIIAVDFLFLRNQLWPRLAANIAIVLIFAALYFIFLRHR